MLTHMESRSNGVRRDQVWLQPRPAFGLRPWFAFLRRARSFRRFAFAMTGRIPGTSPYQVSLSDGAWRVEGIAVASSFLQRLGGMHAGRARGVLLHTSSVHGKGLSDPLQIIHLTSQGVVAARDVLMPGQTVSARSFWILELSLEEPAPTPGAPLVVLPSSHA